jgi:hypothetical protein
MGYHLPAKIGKYIRDSYRKKNKLEKGYLNELKKIFNQDINKTTA